MNLNLVSDITSPSNSGNIDSIIILIAWVLILALIVGTIAWIVLTLCEKRKTKQMNKRKCSHCGTEHKENSNFCSNCGRKIEGEK